MLAQHIYSYYVLFENRKFEFEQYFLKHTNNEQQNSNFGEATPVDLSGYYIVYLKT